MASVTPDPPEYESPSPAAVLPLSSVRSVAESEGYSESYFNENSKVISFCKPGDTTERVRINVYYTTGTVATCINHPKQGRTQLFRRNVSLEQLKEILTNPRVHTGQGYYRRSQRPSSPIEGDYIQEPSSKRARCSYDDGTIHHVEPSQLEHVMEEVLDEESAIHSKAD